MSNSPLFASFRNQFFYAGFWNSIPTKTYKLYSYLILIIHIYFMTIYILLTKNSESIPDFGFNFGATLTLVVTLMKILISRTPKFQKIISEMLMNDEYMSSATLNVLQKNYLHHTRDPFKIINLYRKTMTATLFCNVLISLFIYLKNRSTEPSIEKPFAFKFLIPFDEQNYYLMGHIHQNFVAISVGFIVVSSDFLMLAPILYLNCRIKTLKFVLRNPHLFLNENYPSRKNYFNLVRTCVLEHQAIIRDRKKFNSIMMFISLCDFFFHSTQIAGFLVSIVASETVSNAVNIFNLACAIFVFFQLFIVYWHGQILIEESGTISSAIFQGDWFEADHKTKRILITMMTRSIKPLSLTVGPLFVVNLELFLKITKTVYTITTLFFKT